MHGGRSRYSYFSGFPLSLSIRLGQHFRELITGSIKTAPIIFRRFIRPKFSAARRTQFSGRNLDGGHRGCYSRPRSSGFMGSGRFSPHLLLLPRRLLQSVLGRSAGLHRRRTTKRISGRELFSADHAEHSPLLPLHRVVVHPRPRARRMESNVVQRWFGFASISGLALGTIVLTLNVFLLGSYTFGCHSLRHLIGGFLDEISKVPVCAKGYACVSCLNRRHMLWAWMSLFWVGFSDLYVRLCSMGLWHDWRDSLDVESLKPFDRYAASPHQSQYSEAPTLLRTK